MPDKTEEILAEIRQLKSWLYGKNGFEGDIPEIKSCFRNHSKRLRILEIAVAGLIASGILGSGIYGIAQLFTGG